MASEVIMPRVDMDMAEGKIAYWYVKDGDKVSKGQALFDIETDKATMEVEAHVDGIIQGVQGPIGVMLPVGTVVAWLMAEGEALPASAQGGEPHAVAAAAGAMDNSANDEVADDKAEDAAIAASAAQHGAQGSPTGQWLRATPLARSMAREQQIDLSQVQGSGPAGRVLSSDLPSGVAVQSVAAHSTALHAQWLTQGEGVPLVLLHGFGADHGSWKPFAAMLEGKASLAIDLPNHGKSPLQTTDSLAGLAQAVWSTLQAQGVTQCHLLGHSLGGAVALSLVELAPGLVKSVSLIAPAGLGPDINGAFIDGLCRAESEASLRPWMEELVSDRKLISGSFIATAHKQLAAPAKRTALRAMAARLMPDGTQSESVRHVLQDLRVPTKVIWGTEDRIIPAHHGHHLPGQIGLHVLRGVGHLPYVESPQLVAQLVVQQMRH